MLFVGLLGGLVGKDSTCNVGGLCLIPGLGRSLGEEMATHSSILALRIPWTVQSMGSQRVGWTQLSDFHFTSLVLFLLDSWVWLEVGLV